MPYVSHLNYVELVKQNGKRCSACTKKKAAEEFSVARDRSDGRSAYCKLCIKERYTETKRRYEREKRDRSKKAASNKRGLELKKFRAATEAMDKLYPSHFRREES